MAQTQTQVDPSSLPFERSCLLQDVRTIEGNVTVNDVTDQLKLAHAALDIIYKGGTLPRGKWLRRLLKNLGTINSQIEQIELGALTNDTRSVG